MFKIASLTFFTKSVSGRDRRVGGDGEGDETRQHRGQRPTTRVRKDQLAGGAGVPERNGGGRKLCMGKN